VRSYASRKEFLAAYDPGRPGCLVLLVGGKRSKQIAATLGVSTRTVEGHRSRLLDKMQVDSAAALVGLLLRSGVVPPA
jgi:FixJ family two-component response regulator